MHTKYNQRYVSSQPGVVYTMTYSSWFKEYKWPESKDIRIKVCADGYNKVKESNEQNNYLEKTCKYPADTTPPKVTITYSPSKITTADKVTFTADATDNTSVARILIFINNKQVKECTPGIEKTDTEGRKYWECKYTGGPYDRGALSYRAEAIDDYKNKGISEEKTIDVTISIQQPPITLTMCFISGKIYDFPYDSDTLKIKICESKEICDINPITNRPYPVDPVTGICPHTHLACDPDGTFSYVDVSRVGNDYWYQARVSCTGTYIIMPVYQSYEYECEWKGSWDPDKYILEMDGTGHSRCDFTFEPLDLNVPNLNIEFSNDEPETNEDVEIRILAEDDKGIRSAFVKIDRAYHDGSSIAGDWREVGITTQSFDAASGLYKAAAIELFSEDGVKTIVVNAMVCDKGGNRNLARPRILSFGCLPITFTFYSGGRMMKSSIPIFGFPDEDEDGINDCWENAAMVELNPWIELDEEDNLFEHDRDPGLRSLSDRPYVTLEELEDVLPGHKVVNFARITPYTNSRGQRFILFYYIVSWSKDYGRYLEIKLFEAHNGDTEQLIMAWKIVENLEEGRAPDTIQLECIYIQAHGGCNKRDDLWEPIGVSCNEAGICDFNSEKVGTEETCSELEFRDNRLYLYASEDKHCLYPTCQACEAVTIVLPDTLGWDWDNILGSLVNLIGGILQWIGKAILWVWDTFVDMLTFWKDDHLNGTQVAAWDYATLRDTPGATPPSSPEGGIPSLRIEGDLTFQGSDYHYRIEYHIEKDFTNEELPHVRIVVDNLYCIDETNPEKIWFFGWHNWVHDEPYVIITGFSVYPEGVTTWSVGEPRFDQVDDNEIREINLVVFDGEINPYYIIGFTAALYEDDGFETGREDRRNMGNRTAEELGRKLRGEEEVGGECGEHLLRRIFNIEVGEDCSGGGVYRFPVVNVGEPPEGHLLINDLTNYGFPGEKVSGIWCGDKYGFRGGLGSDGCSTSILDWIQDISIEEGHKHFEKLYERLRH
ncbi:MAG: Ig-like domain-containing protein [Caldisericota bacterium]|nr:Ig-like domain-containing protein [Caldisericota bacterium]